MIHQPIVISLKNMRMMDPPAIYQSEKVSRCDTSRKMTENNLFQDRAGKRREPSQNRVWAKSRASQMKEEPIHRYFLGDCAKEEDMAVYNDTYTKITEVSRLREKDYAFLRRTTGGKFTFAMVLSRQHRESEGEAAIEFKVDEKGTTKLIPLSHCVKYVCPLKPGKYVHLNRNASSIACCFAPLGDPLRETIVHNKQWDLGYKEASMQASGLIYSPTFPAVARASSQQAIKSHFHFCPLPSKQVEIKHSSLKSNLRSSLRDRSSKNPSGKPRHVTWDISVKYNQLLIRRPTKIRVRRQHESLSLGPILTKLLFSPVTDIIGILVVH